MLLPVTTAAGALGDASEVVSQSEGRARAAASAPAPNLFTLRKGDFAVVKGTAIQCSRFNATRTTPSGVRCALKSRGGDLPGTYGGIVLSDKSVVVSRTDADRKPEIVFVSEGRKTASRRPSGTVSPANPKATGRTYPVGVGDVINVEGSSVSCKVGRAKNVYVLCASRVDKRGPMVGSKGFVLDAGGTIIATTFDAKRKPLLLYPLPGGTLRLQASDTVGIAGTSIFCMASSTPQVAIAVSCGNLVNGTWNGSAVFLLTDKGQLVAGPSDSTGNVTPEYVRTLGVEQRSGQNFSASVGSTLRFADSAVTCKSERPARGLVQLECFLAGANGKPLRLSYGARIGSDMKIEAGRYDQSGVFKVQYRHGHA